MKKKLLRNCKKQDKEILFFIKAINRFDEGKLDEGKQELENAIQKGSLYAKLFFAGALAEGKYGYNQDIIKAYNIYKELCNKNIYEACINLNVILEKFVSINNNIYFNKELEFYNNLIKNNNICGYSLLYRFLKLLYSKEKASKYIVDNYGFFNSTFNFMKIYLKKIFYKYTKPYCSRFFFS